MVFDCEVLHHLLPQKESQSKFSLKESNNRDLHVWRHQFETAPSVFEEFIDLSASASYNVHSMKSLLLSEFPRWSKQLLSEDPRSKMVFRYRFQSNLSPPGSTESQCLYRFDEDILLALDLMRAESPHFLDLQHFRRELAKENTAQKLRDVLRTPDVVRHELGSVPRPWCKYSCLTPIMARELQTATNTILHVNGTCATFPRPKKVIDHEIPLQFVELLSSLRSNHTLVAEQCLWSSASREVMRKCHVQNTRRGNTSNQRSHILRETRHRELFLPLPNPLTASGTTMLGLDKHTNELLRSYCSRAQTFLPLKVNVYETRPEAMRGEISTNVKTPSSQEKNIFDKLNTFDIIKRTPNLCLSTKILKIGARIRDDDSRQHYSTKRKSGAEPYSDGESTSQESLLDNILPSDNEDMEELGAQHFRGEPESCTGTRKVNTPQESITRELSFIPLQNNEAEKGNVRLRVPEDFVCPMWSVRLAEFCFVQMPRGTILLPPCLSALPTLCIVMYSHLTNQLQDQRIAIICDAEAGVSRCLHAYLENSFGRKVSIEIISRGCFSKEPRFASVEEYTAQVFILDSFDFSLPPRVSLLLILICQPHLFDSQTLLEPCSAQHIINPDWRHLPSILIAPLDSWVLFSSYVKRAEQISLQLDMSTVLFVPEYDDVHHSVLLTKPRGLFLVPLNDASELVSVIDTHGSSVLNRLRKYIHEPQMATSNSRTHPMFDSSLRDISVSLLRFCLENQTGNIGTEIRADLETVYYLRQARSYALYDGVDVASAFLAHCVAEMSSEDTTLIGVMKKVELITATRITTEHDHPIIRPVIDHIRKARLAFNSEAPSLFSIHRRHAFRPLIIANSTETVDGFRRGKINAKLILEAEDTDLAVCWANDLASLREKKILNGYEKKVLDQMESFSHIYHILGDRDDRHPDLQLPTQIVQLVHAGRTRLIIVAVDERRQMEPTWRANEVSYSVMKKYIGDQRILAGMGRGEAFWDLKWDTVQYMMNSLW